MVFETVATFAASFRYAPCWVNRGPIYTCFPKLVLTKGTKTHQRKVGSARLIVYTADFNQAGLDFQDRVPILSLLGLPLDMVRERLGNFRHGWDKVVYTTKSIRVDPIFLGTRTFFIRTVPKFFYRVNGPVIVVSDEVLIRWRIFFNINWETAHFRYIEIHNWLQGFGNETKAKKNSFLNLEVISVILFLHARVFLGKVKSFTYPRRRKFRKILHPRALYIGSGIIRYWQKLKCRPW